MKRLLIIGCGDVAMRAIPLLVRRYRVFALVRNVARCADLRAADAVPLRGDLDDRASLSRIAGLADAVLHLAPPRSSGVHDTRTANLLSALSRRTLPKRLVYISTSGVYGDCGGAEVSETRPLNPQTARALRRADAEARIRSWSIRNRVTASILRVPGIYAANRLSLDRLQQGTPCIADSEDSYTNHIHADDLARVVLAALSNGSANRAYNASDDSRMKMGEYFDAVADAVGLPRAPHLGRAEAQRMLPESLLSFMNESRLLSNQRMKKELRVRLRYPTVADCLATIGHHWVGQ